jgi:hypothetical protein
MPASRDARLDAMLDREDILDLVRRERFARDQRRFEIMADCFNPGGRVRTSWYDGTTEDYTEATRARMGTHDVTRHWVFPGFVTINGARATVESPACIFNRFRIEGVEIDYFTWCRFFSRVERRDGVWRLSSFEVLFERDIMRTVNPADRLPVDWDVLATYRPSYRFLTHAQEVRGARVNPDLLGDDRREELAAFMAGEQRWLEGAA